MSAPDWIPTLGGGATICHYSDRIACTVTRISPSGKTIWMQEDTADLDGWKPEVIAGGFAGHCVNNAEQTYKYSPNPDGVVHRAGRRKDGRYCTTHGKPVIPGRRHFHDYNF